MEQDKYLIDSLKEVFQNVKQFDTTKKRTSTYKANDTKVLKSKEAINKAIKQLKENNGTITAYRIAKVAKISYNTVKKYQKEVT